VSDMISFATPLTNNAMVLSAMVKPCMATLMSRSSSFGCAKLKICFVEN